MRVGYPIGIEAEATLHTVDGYIDTDRGRGALLGLCVGDALGTTLEFTTPAAVPLPELMSGPHRHIVGQGPFRLVAGQVTDDTQMACCIAASLMTQGRFDAEDVAARYLGWRLFAFDIGGQTSASLSQVSMGVAAEFAGHEVWLERHRNAAGNGSLMRTAPIAVFFANHPDRRRAASLDDSTITHFDPRCQIACAAFNAAIAQALTTETDPYRMTEVAGREVRAAASLLIERYPEERATIKAAEKDLMTDLDSAADANPRLYGPEIHLLNHAGYVRVGFRLAFWHLLHSRSLEDALIDVVNRGGDADTNAAITGALLGAAYGESAIPAEWSACVLEALQNGDNESPLRDAYHPKLLLRMVPL